MSVIVNGSEIKIKVEPTVNVTISDIGQKGEDGQDGADNGKPWVKASDSSAIPLVTDEILHDGDVIIKGVLKNTSPNLDGTTDLRYLWKIQALADKTVSFNFGTSTTNIAETNINNDVFMFGWNLAPGGSAETSGKSAIGLSFENSYEPIVGTDIAEYHTFFVTKAGVQKRLESYTINKDLPDTWERFNTLALDYHKHPSSENVYCTLAANNSNGVVKHTYTDPRLSTQKGVEHYMDPNQFLYSITPLNFKTLASEIWQNQIVFDNFGQFITAGFSSIKYNSVVVFNFRAPLQTFANDAAAGVGGVAQHGLYRTATGEVRIKL